MVEVVGVIVAVPAPRFCTSKNQPDKNDDDAPAWGKVTAIGEALEKVTSLRPSLCRTV
jgi:hypothetical protein